MTTPPVLAKRGGGFSCCRPGAGALAFSTLRKAFTCLLWLILLVHAALPAVPGFVCLGMGGAHRLAPCCETEAPDERPAWSVRCCEAAPAPALQAWGNPPEPAAAPVLPVAVIAAAIVLPIPSAVSAEAPSPRSGAPPGPSQPRYVLRI